MEVNSAILFHVIDGVSHPFDGMEDHYKSWLSEVVRAEGKSIVLLSFIFCSDDYLLDINMRYLGHDYYTDIITFPYQEGSVLESDLYISIDRVRENADTYNETFDNELKRVMVHGVLHLMGYGDKSDEQIADMRSKENYYIKTFGTATI